MKSWEKQPGETDADYLVFQLWLTREYEEKPWVIKPRSMPKLALFTGRPESNLSRLASLNNWNQRADAFDQSKEMRRVLGEPESPTEFRRRKNRVVDTGLDLLEEAMVLLKTRMDKGYGKVGFRDLATFADTMLHYKAEVLAEQPEESGDFLDAFDLSGLSNEELVSLAKIATKVKPR